MLAQLDRLYWRLGPGKALSRLLAYALFEGRPVTTRGRWINPLVFSLSALLTRLPELRAVRRPVFVIGMGRSGTTYLARVLSLHPDLCLLNEPKALWHAVHAEQDVIGSYSRRPGRLRLEASDAGPDVARRAHRLYGACAALFRAERVLDKYPEMLFRTAFLRALFPEAVFVAVIRDGWSTCRSVASWSARHARTVRGVVHDWWGVGDRKWTALLDELAPAEPDLLEYLPALRATRSPLERAAVEWTLSLREVQRLVRSAGPALHLVRHEDLARAPEESIAAVLSACDLASDERVLEYARRSAEPARPALSFELPAPLRAAFERTLRDSGYGDAPGRA